MGTVDWQPVVGAIAALIVALTPIAVGFLSVQLSQFRAHVAEQFADSRADRAVLHAEVAKVAAKVDNTANAMSGRRDRREGDK